MVRCEERAEWIVNEEDLSCDDCIATFLYEENEENTVRALPAEAHG